MKVGVAIYFRNITQYPQRWVHKCFESIIKQTRNDFEIYMLDYGRDTGNIVFDHQFDSIKVHRQNKPMQNYAAAMNYVYEWIFKTCDVAVNVNVDDFYHERRIELLLQEIEAGADIASSNYYIIDIKDRITWKTDYANADIYKTLIEDKINPISNPAHIMHHRVFEKLQFDPSLVPAEDMSYWQACIEAGFKIKIRPEYLHYYRQHNLQATWTKDKI